MTFTHRAVSYLLSSTLSTTNVEVSLAC